MNIHRPVLLQKVIDFLSVKKGGFYVDATFGQGGHSEAILKLGGRILGIEWDKDQYQKSKIKYQKELEEKRLILVNDNFSKIEAVAKKNKFFPVDGVLFDLGISMTQIADGRRGFSFKNLDEPLDLRINQSIKIKASDWLNRLSKEELYQILAKNAEIINFRPIVDEIIFQRRLKPIVTVADLVSIIDRAVKQKEEKIYRLVWQSLRIFVNNELENLKNGLIGAKNILKKDGRILLISFHSLEDRLVKQFVKENSLIFLTKKPVSSVTGWSFERSAKLRVISF